VFNGDALVGTDISKVLITVFGLDGYLGSKIKTYYLVGEWFTGFILILYVFSQPAIYLAKKNPLALIVLATISSWLSILLSEDIFNNFFLWNKEPLWNPTSRLMEFSFGIITSLYLLKSNFKMNIAATVSVFYLFLLFLLKVNLLQFTLLGTTFCIAAFMIVLKALMLIRFNPHFSCVINFLSKYSFLAFLFHHQVIMQILIKVKLFKITYSDIIYIVTATIFISYFLAFVAYRPSIFLKNIVFKHLLK